MQDLKGSLLKKNLKSKPLPSLFKKLLNLKEKNMLAEKIIQTSKPFFQKGIPLNTVLKRLQIPRPSFYY
jgi:hypothetical protein